MTKLMLPAVALMIAGPLLAGAARAADPAAGEAMFSQCKACHSVVAPDGTEYQRGGRTGPNLWGVIGRPVAADPDYAYGEGLSLAGGNGAHWDAGNFAAYLADPAGWVAQASGVEGAQSNMNFALPEGAADIAAYLQSVSN